MNSLNTALNVSESLATSLILDACRSNSKFAAWNKGSKEVVFSLENGERRASLFDGYKLIAVAFVDEFDC